MQISDYNPLETSAVSQQKIADQITDLFKKLFKPPPRLNLVEWADRFRHLPPNSAEPGRWKTSRVPVAREPMMSISDRKVQEVTVMSCIQLMKHLHIDTPILTVNGFKTMGEMVTGDQVYGSDGQPCNVIAVSETTTKEPCYKITFSDGATVICSESHNWNVLDGGENWSTKWIPKTLNTLDISKQVRNKRGSRYRVNITKPIVKPFADLPIDPYVLGVWLGDGLSKDGRIIVHKDDVELLNHVEKQGYKVMSVYMQNNGTVGNYRIHKVKGDETESLRPILRSEDLLLNKHIPEKYLNASIEQRLDLLKGLMDTDGCCKLNGQCTFSQSSKSLIDQVFALITSLGFLASIKYNPVKYKGDFVDSWIISFSADSTRPVFKLNRKLARLKNPNRKNNNNLKKTSRAITNVEKIDNVPVKCIAVDSPDHLYLCGRELIPTHNTELMLNTAMYYMHQEPSPIMYVAPKLQIAEAWSKERLTQSVNHTPVLKNIFSDNRRDQGNTILQKQFPGGQISIVSARNPDDLAMRACRIMLFDECDKYPVNVGAGDGGSGGEGDPIAVAWGRATTYGRRAKKITACSPTVANKSRIEQEYKAGNQSIFFMPCPKCGHTKEIEWPDVVIPVDKKTGEMLPDEAFICCSECDHHWSEGERRRAAMTGFWVAKRPEVKHHHSYKVSSLASPFTPVTTLANEFIKAKGNPQLLKAFYNTRMARTWREHGDQPDWEQIYERRERYKIGIIPEGGLMLTMGIDVQKEGIYYEVVAYGRRKISWSVEYGYMTGDIETDEFREEIKKLWDRVWPTHNGIEIQCEKIAIDSGYKTNAVYSLVREYADQRVVAVKGDKEARLSTILGTPTPVDVNWEGKRMSRGLYLWHVGSGVIKEQFYNWVTLRKPTPEKLNAGGLWPTGYCHFPEYDEEFFKQITAEQRVMIENKKGFETYVWEKTRKDNHLLDCRVYSRAAASMLQLERMTDDDWDDREKLYAVDSVKPKADTNTTVKPKPKKAKKESFWKNRRR